jgi:DNA-binding transcriptional LysR family regulator
MPMPRKAERRLALGLASGAGEDGLLMIVSCLVRVSGSGAGAGCAGQAGICISWKTDGSEKKLVKSIEVIDGKSMLDTVTLDQLRMLAAIEEAGSFTAAARKLQRAQSAVSHAIAVLEGHLGVTLFDRSSRMPVLTPEGQAVLEDARVVLARAERLKARARGMASGQEAEITIAASVVLPRAALVSVLRVLRTEFPSLSVRLFVEEVGGAPQLVADGTADLGIVGAPSLRASPADGTERIAIGFVDIVAVAAPDHPLAGLKRTLIEADLLDHRQLVPTSRALPRYANRMVQDVWEVADLAVRCDMMRAGMGWGTAPLHMVEADIAAGRLIQLDITARPDEAMRVPLYAIHRTTQAPGPAGRWLTNALQQALRT